MRKSIVAAATITAVLSIGTSTRNATAMSVVTPGQLGLADGVAESVEKTVLICGPWGCHWRPRYWMVPALSVPVPLLGRVPPLPVPLLGLAPPLLVGLASAPLVGSAPLVTGLLLGRTRQRRDEMGAGLRQGKSARCEGVPFQEKSGEREGIGKIGCR